MATLTWRRPGATATDPVRGTVVQSAPPTVVLDATAILPGPSNATFEGQQLRRVDHRKILLAGEELPAGVDIALNDVLTFEGADWTVYDVKRLAPDGGAVILWTVFVRR